MESNNFKSIFNGSDTGEIKVHLEVNGKKYPFRSFVLNFRNQLFKLLGGSGVSLSNLNNTNLTPTNYMKVNSAADDFTHGIIIGNTITLENNNPGINDETALTDYNLKYNLPPGAGGTNYSAQETKVTLTNSSVGITLTVSRRFYVNSPDGLAINDIGLVASSVTSSHSPSTSYLITRDVIPVQSFPQDSVVQISLIFSLTANSGFLINFLKILQSYFTNSAVNIATITGARYNENFSGSALTWNMAISSGMGSVFPEQIQLSDLINITQSYPALTVTDSSGTIAYLTFKGSFDNLTTNTFRVSKVGLMFGKGSNKYLVNVANVGSVTGALQGVNEASRPTGGAQSIPVLLPPDKLYRAIHSLGFKK
jgi:hypothetical protein